MRDQTEIEEQLNEAVSLTAEGKNPYPGMTYAHGVRDALAWALLESDDAPLEVE